MDVLSYVIGVQAGKKSGGGSGGSGGGGGGALPPGVYYENDGMGIPRARDKSFFPFNGNTYCLSADNAASAYKAGTTIYRYDGASWVSVVATPDMSYSAAQGPYAFFGGELNGKIHIKASKTHYVFDGTTLTKLNDLPSGELKLFIDGGKLMGTYSNNYYEWDETTDAWTLITVTTPSGVLIKDLWTVGNNTYASDYNKKHYRFNNNAWEDTGVVLGGFPDRTNHCVIGNKLYYYRSYTATDTVNRQAPLYCIDYETMTETKAGSVPKSTRLTLFKDGNNNLRYYDFTEADASNNIIHYIPE